MNLPNIEHLVTMVSQMDALAEVKEAKEFAAKAAQELGRLIDCAGAQPVRTGVGKNFPLISQIRIISALRRFRDDIKILTKMQPSEHHEGMLKAYTKVIKLMGAEE